MSHVPPHRWADAFAGNVADLERAAMDRHAEQCRACARAKARIGRASDSFASIRTQSAPELSWDEVRARVHWNVSTERRAKVRAPASGRRIVGWCATAGAVAAAIALAVATGPLDVTRSQTHASPIGELASTVKRRVHLEASPPATPAALVGIVTRARGAVMMDGILERELFTKRVVAGTTLATGNGAVDVQFGSGSAFALGPRSMVEVRHFDARTIELVVEGQVDVEVAPRVADQRFVVVAGARTVEVRGTQFRVRHDGTSTFVACRHGLVAVRDTHGVIELPAERRVELEAGRALSSGVVAAMSREEIDELASATPLALDAWGNLDALLGGSAPLEIATAGPREVRVDGVELGHAPLRVRVMTGRHTVEVADGAGRYRRAGWVDVAAPTPGGKPARLEIAPDPPPTRNVEQRRRQLVAGMAKDKLARCTRAIAKSGLTGTYVQISIGVDANGAVNFLNVIDTDLPNATASCVRDVLAETGFGKGAAAIWRQRIDL